MYMVHDTETTIKSYMGRKGSPFHPDNRVVCNGYLVKGQEPRIDYYETKEDLNLYIPDDVNIIVGFNWKFDALHHWHLGSIQEFLKRGGWVWDCQLAEYFLGFMQPDVHYASLNNTAVKYGGEHKIDAVKALWEAGVDTPDIDRDLLSEYLVGDLVNTKKIFLGQIQKATKLGMLRMLRGRMDSVMATTEMEYNGLHIDTKKGEELTYSVRKELLEVQRDLQVHVDKFNAPFDINMGSSSQLSALLFGGAVKYSVREHLKNEDGTPKYHFNKVKVPLFNNEPRAKDVQLQDGMYYLNGTQQDVFKAGLRKGQPKFRNMKYPDRTRPVMRWKEYVHKFPGVVKPEPAWKGSRVDAEGNPIYSVNEEVIKELGNRGVEFTDLLSKRNALNKDLNTYYMSEDGSKGMLTLVNREDSRIHHNLNHTSTVTGRLSSSGPNFQNIPKQHKSRVREVFTSRFGDDGYMVEIDYSQLEVVVQAVLSKDKQLIEDLNNKVDFHCKRVSLMLDKPYDYIVEWCSTTKEGKQVRTQAKIFTFQMQYGGGVKLISISTGMTEEQVTTLMELEAKAYPSAAAFDEAVRKEVLSSAKMTRKKVWTGAKFEYALMGTYQAPTGTIYGFPQQESPDFLKRKGQNLSFSPTTIKNYPKQGFGGEIVEHMIGLLYRDVFLPTNNYNGLAFMCNTVHDSVWFDIHSSVAHEVSARATEVLASVPSVFNAMYPHLDIQVEFPVDTEYGRNLYDMNSMS